MAYGLKTKVKLDNVVIKVRPDKCPICGQLDIYGECVDHDLKIDVSYKEEQFLTEEFAVKCQYCDSKLHKNTKRKFRLMIKVIPVGTDSCEETRY